MSSNYVSVYVEGAGSRNPGPGSISIVIIDENNKEVHRHEEPRGETTNNRAEYRALIKGLELAAGFSTKKAHCYSDSEIVVKQLNRVDLIKNPELEELHEELRSKEALFEEVVYQHAGGQNSDVSIADKPTEEALVLKKTWPPLAFTLFFIPVILVGVLTTVRLTCPLDQGTGILTAVKDLKAESVEMELIGMENILVPPTGYVNEHWVSEYTYTVNILLINETTKLSQGNVALIFDRRFSSQYIAEMDLDVLNPDDEVRDSTPSPLLFSVYVEVPAGTTKNYEIVYTFRDLPFIDIPIEFQVQPHGAIIEPGIYGLPCPTSGGTGKLSVAEWLQAMLSK